MKKGTRQFFLGEGGGKKIILIIFLKEKFTFQKLGDGPPPLKVAPPLYTYKD
jgi:hypothetical protein